MYKELIQHMKDQARGYAQAADMAKAWDYGVEVEQKYRTFQIEYLSAIDLVSLMDKQDLSMNKPNAPKE